MRKGVRVHIGNRKELENYLIDFGVIYRAFIIELQKRNPTLSNLPSKEEFDKDLLSLTDLLKMKVYTQRIGKKIQLCENRGLDYSTITEEVLNEIEANWNSIEYRLKVIPGKDFLTIMNGWLSKNYKISLSDKYILKTFSGCEFDSEICKTIKDFMDFVI